MVDQRGSVRASGGHISGGGIYTPSAHEGPGQAWLYPIVYVLHLANGSLGNRTVSKRIGRVSGPGVLPAEFLRQHSGYPALSSPGWRAVDVQVPGCSRGNA